MINRMGSQKKLVVAEGCEVGADFWRCRCGNVISVGSLQCGECWRAGKRKRSHHGGADEKRGVPDRRFTGPSVGDTESTEKSEESQI